jgi:crotonobetainyl-CoA:carnitine CoA-transferase CaiB-like acyl-CoA transferase
MQHPAAGTVKVIANPVRLSETPADYRIAPRALGADTDSVLRDIARMTDAEIASLREKNLV